MVNRKISDTDMDILRDHIQNTSTSLVKCYKIGQLAIMDRTNSEKIKRHPEKYIPVRIDTNMTLDMFYRRRTNKPYCVRYIRLDEIQYIFKKRTGKRLVVEE